MLQKNTSEYMKRLSILGSTGSIGTNTLKIVEMFPDQFDIKALAAAGSIETLAHQIQRFKPELAVVIDEDRARALKQLLPSNSRVNILFGENGYKRAAVLDDVTMVVGAMVGAAGLMPTLAAIDAGKDVALANKETLVMAGEIVMRRAVEKNVRILPIDSEHSAIFQCMAGSRTKDLDKILLTASGGPFRTLAKEKFADISLEDALNHPNWSMGPKITIDSATLMNKGLEFIEAKHLFGVSEDMIQIVIHPQSIIHSMVAYKDGSVMAQMGIPDMKQAIAYALSYPKRLALHQPLPNFTDMAALTFEKPDLKRFPCLTLALAAIKTGGTLPAVLNAANETAVYAFLNRQLGFEKISTVIEETMTRHNVGSSLDLSEIIAANRWARNTSQKIILSFGI
jgi:1-deoxy-D-xylulose-5-phosphate reductoisomerase